MENLARRVAELSASQQAWLSEKLMALPATDTMPILPKIERGEAWVDLQAEARLDDAIYPQAASAARPGGPQAVLLTGVTGFLGAFLAYELLKQTRATVYCLVRADSFSGAAEKIQKNLKRYGLNTPETLDRLVPVVGDIARPLLGMRPGDWETLSQKIDCVYHNAALANFFQPYALLKPANVNGTHEALRFACAGRQKPFHYVSTVGVFDSATPENPLGFAESEFPESSPALNRNGYVQSKWVAEKLVRIARQRGVETTIYRPASITGDTRYGAWNTDDYICCLIKSCVDMNLAPEEEILFNMVPVDYASRSIVHLSMQAENHGRTFHISNPGLVSSKSMIDYGNTLGFQVGYAPFGDWLKAAWRVASVSDGFALSPFLTLLEADGGEDGESQAQRYQCAETLEALAGGGIACPRIDESILNVYFRFLIKQGFLPVPAGKLVSAMA